MAKKRVKIDSPSERVETVTPVEQPEPSLANTDQTQPRAEPPAITEPKAEAAAGEAEAKTPPTPESPEQFIKRLIDTVNAQGENINKLAAHIEALEGRRSPQQLGGGLKGLGQTPPNTPQGQGGGGPPGWITDLIPIVLPMLQKAIMGGEPAKENPVADQLSKRIIEYQARQMNKIYERIIEVIEASDEGRLQIQKKEGEEPKPGDIR